VICQSFPELAVDERHDATWVFWCAAVVLAVSYPSLASVVFWRTILYQSIGDSTTDLACCRHFFQYSAPSTHVDFMSCGCIPARSDGHSSQYILGLEDLIIIGELLVNLDQWV
jgi:hypothetical protein